MTRPLADGWYGELLPEVDRFVSSLRGPVRGVALFMASWRRPAVAITRNDPGWRALLLLRAAFGIRRKLVVLHFIRHPGGGLGRLDRWATRRAVLRAQVLTGFERSSYAECYGVDRFEFVPYARRRSREGALPEFGDGRVVSGGRAWVDWEGLRDAAIPGLVTVCSTSDRDRAPGELLVDMPHDHFTAWLPGASVFVIAMRESGAAQGHVRVKDAIDAGVPIVATRVRALDGYLTDGVDALLVPEGDAAALRAAVERLSGDRELADRLRRAAWDRAAEWTWPDYLAAVGRLVAP